MSDRHRYQPISFRPSAEDRAWLYGQEAATGRPVRAILAEALAAYRRKAEPSKLDQLRAARAASDRRRARP